MARALGIVKGKFKGIKGKFKGTLWNFEKVGVQHRNLRNTRV